MTNPGNRLVSELKTLLGNSPVTIWTTDQDLRITSSTKSQDAIGQTLFDFFQTKDINSAPIQAHRKALAGETSQYELDWANISYESFVGPLKDDQGFIIGVVGLSLDVTERKILETQFIASQKMEAVGRLAGGIAHDFNNLLTVILNYAELLEDDLKDNPKAKPRLEAIINSANQTARLTNQLLAFSRQQVHKEQILDVNTLVTSLAHMLSQLIGEDIEFTLKLKENISKVSADPNQIIHILMTWMHRSRDAMKQGGKLTLATDVVNDSVVISVHDTGAEIESAAQKKLFELGGNNVELASITGAVKQIHGNISVESGQGKGTTFKLVIPALQPAKTNQTRPEITSSDKTILVVEDEDIVRQVACDIIRDSGYHVLEAKDALKALELCFQAKDPVDLVLTDLIMPKMNGPELVKKLSMKFPDLGVVYMSGYSSDAAMGKGILQEKASFVQKPFMPKTLLKALQDTLNGETVAVS